MYVYIYIRVLGCDENNFSAYKTTLRKTKCKFNCRSYKPRKGLSGLVASKIKLVVFHRVVLYAEKPFSSKLNTPYINICPIYIYIFIYKDINTRFLK